VKICVLLKQVPDTETAIKIAPDGRSIVEDGIKWVINPYDEIAVEEALKLKEKIGGEVVIVTAGPARAVESMRQALAMGADRGVRIDTEGVPPDPFITARILAEACRAEKFDIIFAGKQAVDDGLAQVHIGVAEMLGIPHVSPVEKFEISSHGRSATLTRAAAGGVKEIIDSFLPLVVGCEKGLNNPRYATLPGILKAKSKQIAVMEGQRMTGDAIPRLSIAALKPPPERKPGRIIEGGPAKAAQELARLLREEAKVI